MSNNEQQSTPRPARRTRPAASPSARVQQIVERVTASDATQDEVREALGLLPATLAESDAWHLALLRAAKYDAGLTWKEIGRLMGFPESSAAQRALWKFRHLDDADPGRIRRSRR